MSLRIGRWSVVGFTGICLLIGASVSPAAIKYVTKTGLDSAAGTQAAPYRTIQWGVTNIATGDSLYVGEGTYVESVANPATGPSITLMGGWNTNNWSWDPKNHPTIINPGNAGLNVLTITAATNTVAGFTLTGGAIGLVYNYSGGILPQLLANCIISNNASHGISLSSTSQLNAKNCLVVTNGGSGVYSYTDSGKYYYLANFTVAYNRGSGLNIAYQYDPHFNITNCIVAFNGGGGIILSYISASQQGINEASSSCIFGNAAGNIPVAANMSGGFYADSGVIQADPKFVNPAAGDFHLQNGSPCVGYGKNLTGYGVTNDLENTARSAPFDMGCYQSANTPLTLYSATYADTGVGSDANLGNGPGAAAAKKTIGAALAVTAARGTCNVAAGTYAETAIVPYYGITLQGAGQDSTMITNPANWMGVWMYESNIVLRGFTVVGNNNGHGVMIGGPDPSFGSGSIGPSACANVIDQCTIRNANYGVWMNIPVAFAGATATGYQQSQLNRCTIVSNLVDGIYIYQGVRATNCLIVYNGANGVQVFNDGNLPRSYFLYCTIASNVINGYYSQTANGQGGGSTCFLTNCIVTGNGSVGIYKISTSPNVLFVGYSMVSGQPTNFGGVGGGTITINAGVITNQVPTFTRGFKLADGSVGIDIATNIGVMVDLIGGVRPFGAGYDMGAYEFIRPPRGTIFMTR